ncbi:MAG: TIGR04028 family ABC transporter substrate-binding protein [Galbitalea sp.]
MTSRKILRLTVAALAGASVVAALTACATAAAPAATTASSSKPIEGGTLVYLEQGAATNLYPPQGGSYTSGGILNNVLDRLTWQDPTSLKIEPWIAKSWTANSTDTEYTFHLRSGVTFSDGTPLDAAAVKKNYDVYGLGDAALNLGKSEVINNYSHSTVVNPSTIEFFFTAPAPGFLQATSTISSGLLAPKSLDQNLNAFSLATNLIGSGPFTVSNEVVNKETDLTVRKDYNWAPPSAAHQGRAYLNEVKYIIEPEDSVRIGSLLSGQGDLIRSVPAYDEKQVTGAGYTLYAPQTKGVNDTINFRPSNPLVSDVRVRQAIVDAVNLNQIHSTLFSANYPVATSVLSNLASDYKNTSALSKYNLAKSKQLLDAAGWKLGSDGVREKDGTKLILNVYYQLPGGQPQTQQTLELVEQQLKKVGVELNILSPSSADYATAVLDPTKTPLYIGDAGRADTDVIGTYFGYTNRNVLRYDDPKLESLLQAADSATDATAKANAVGDVQTYIAQEAYAIPILQEPQVFGGAPYVKDVAFESVGRPTFYGTWIAKH